MQCSLFDCRTAVTRAPSRCSTRRCPVICPPHGRGKQSHSRTSSMSTSLNCWPWKSRYNLQLLAVIGTCFFKEIKYILAVQHLLSIVICITIGAHCNGLDLGMKFGLCLKWTLLSWYCQCILFCCKRYEHFLQGDVLCLSRVYTTILNALHTTSSYNEN